MKKPLFTGVCTALVTPFLNGKVNYPLMEQLLLRQIEAGIPAVVLSGTTGESPTLSDDEKFNLFKRAKEFVGDRCLIIAGTGTNSTEHAISMSVSAEEAGADALLIVSPYYNKGNPEGLFAHYMTIAHSVTLPIIIYNVPSRTGVDIPISVYKRLSVLPNIAGVKEASNDIKKILTIRTVCGEEFPVWTGNDDQIVPAMALGGQGVISVISNIYPKETLDLTDAALKGDYKTASLLQCQLYPLTELLFSEVNPIPVKYAMRYAGFDCGGCRLPLGPLSAENKRRIDMYFQ